MPPWYVAVFFFFLFTFYFGGMILVTIGFVTDIVLIFKLLDRGIHVAGVALATRSNEITDSDDHSHTFHHTKVGFGRGADRHVVEIRGEYVVGQHVPMVYDPDRPYKAMAESHIRNGGLMKYFFAFVILLGMVGLGIFAFSDFINARPWSW